MRFYLILGILFILLIWDIGQNRGQIVRSVVATLIGFLRAIGFI